jgi:hypothetical protein
MSLNSNLKLRLLIRKMINEMHEDVIFPRQYQELTEEDESPVDDETSGLFGGDDAPSDEPAPETKEGPADDDPDSGYLEKGDITTDGVIEKLNSIRAGKSFKDDAIRHSMDSYISGLDKAEKTALFAFLKGIGQIVSGEVTPENATDPSEPPSDVNMNKDGVEDSADEEPPEEPAEPPPAKEPPTEGEPVPLGGGEKETEKTVTPNKNGESPKGVEQRVKRVVIKPNISSEKKKPAEEPRMRTPKKIGGVEDTTPPSPITPKKRP